MDQPPNNHNVGVGGHRTSGSLSTSQGQSGHTAAASGERSSDTARSMQPLPVTSAEGSAESQTPDQGSPALSGGSDWDTSKDQTQPEMLPSTLPEPTKDDYILDAYTFIQQILDPRADQLATCFLSASEQPPVTPESLAELDMPRIINNPKLRHDVNFDRELSFRANLDGTKGRSKLRLAEDYWKGLEGEVWLVSFALQNLASQGLSQDEAKYWQGILAYTQKRLPKLFLTIRDILRTLVPDRDQMAIDDKLDVELIMRQLHNGMFEIADLGNWLAKLIKSHCAPMRDREVEEMRRTIEIGASPGKEEQLVDGIRQLLALLENMKLDVANHQIRHMRPLLVQDTVNFQRKYNAHRISINKISKDDVRVSRLWLEREFEDMTNAGQSPTYPQALASALLKGLVFSDYITTSALYAPTFYLDGDRLRILRNELHARIYQDICKEVLVEMAGKQVSQAELIGAAAELQHFVDTILNGGYGKIVPHLGHVAAKIMQLILALEHKDDMYDSELLHFVQMRLGDDLRTTSPLFKQHGQALVEQLSPKLLPSVEKHIYCRPVHLQDLLVPPAPPQRLHPGYATVAWGAHCEPVIPTLQVDPDEEIIRRFTHILVLHWQVWADLVYTAPIVDAEGSDNDEQPNPPSNAATAGSAASSSPTVPVAQAVYAPGKKWLPVALTVTEVPSGLPTPASTPPADTQSQHSDDDDDDDESDGAVHSGASSNSSNST